jgi:hypothetical protein
MSAVRFIEGNYALMEYSKGWDEYKVWVIFLNPIRVLAKIVTLGLVTIEQSVIILRP